MAFSIRKMFSNMNYFKKPDDQEISTENNENISKKRRHISENSGAPSLESFTELTEPDSTSRVSKPEKSPKKSSMSKTGSLSETDLFKSSTKIGSKKRNKNKKLKLDIAKANKSMNEALNLIDNVENTPKQLVYGCKSVEMFNERLKEFDLSKSFDIFDALSDDDLENNRLNRDIDSISHSSDSNSDVSLISNIDEKTCVKMCRKIEQSTLSLNKDIMLKATSLESFGDVMLDKSEEDRLILLTSYQNKLEQMETVLNQILTEFQFHIEVSKVFHTKSFESENSKIPKIMESSRSQSPVMESWNVVIEKEDILSKVKVKKQLLNIKECVEQFINLFLQNRDYGDDSLENAVQKTRDFLNHGVFSDGNKSVKHLRVKNKRKIKRYSDYPDLKDALEHLFALEDEETKIIELENEIIEKKCSCDCHHDNSQTDSGLNKNESLNQSISSSIGNFSLDNSALTAYSETLDLIVSYNSFNDSNLYNSVLEKTAIERLSFYVQAHSIQIRNNPSLDTSEPKSHILYYCPTCRSTENDEQGLLKHILSQKHCEKIHFQYKTAYIKKCIASGKEIQPSTVLNSMVMYRDENKIVCFGDAMYACSLCFENLIVGESVLMAHCNDTIHVERRKSMLTDFEIEN